MGSLMLRMLTPTELKVADLLTQGASDAQIAHVLGCATSTVKVHQRRIKKKLGAANRTQVAAQMLMTGPARDWKRIAKEETAQRLKLEKENAALRSELEAAQRELERVWHHPQAVLAPFEHDGADQR